MKPSTFSRWLAGSLVVASLSTVAWAGPGFHPVTMGDRQAFARCASASSQQDLNALKVVLQLNSSQESAWGVFVQSMSKAPDRSAWQRPKSMTTLDRLAWMESQLATMGSNQTERFSAIKAFYASLSPSQQRVFDQEFNWMGSAKSDRHDRRSSKHPHLKSWM